MIRLTMENHRRRRFEAWYLATYGDGPTGRSKFMADSGMHGSSPLTKGRVSQLFDPDEPFGELAAKNLAQRLGLPDSFFLTDRPDTALYSAASSLDEPVKSSANSAHEPAPTVYAGIPSYQGMAQVVAIARTSENGDFVEERFEGDTGGWVPKVTEAHSYALRVRGDGLSPVFRSDALLIVEPDSPIESGEAIVIRWADGRTSIKLLQFQRGDALTVTTVQGSAPQTVELRETLAVHPITGTVAASKWRSTPPSAAAPAGAKSHVLSTAARVEPHAGGLVKTAAQKARDAAKEPRKRRG